MYKNIEGLSTPVKILTHELEGYGLCVSFLGKDQFQEGDEDVLVSLMEEKFPMSFDIINDDDFAGIVFKLNKYSFGEYISSII